MKRLLVALTLTAVVAGVVGTSPVSSAERRINVVKATMNGAQAVPGPVDSDGTGRAVFVIDHERQTVRYAVVARRIDEVTEAHVHIEVGGPTGPPVAFLFDFNDVPLDIGSTTEGTARGFASHGVITADDLLGTIPGLTMEGFIDALQNGSAYVNVHTLDFRPGEIRGQIG